MVVCKGRMVSADLNPDDIASHNGTERTQCHSLIRIAGQQWRHCNYHQDKVSIKKGIGVEFNTNWSMDKALILTKFQNEYGQGNGGDYVENQRRRLGC